MTNKQKIQAAIDAVRLPPPPPAVLCLYRGTKNSLGEIQEEIPLFEVKRGNLGKKFGAHEVK